MRTMMCQVLLGASLLTAGCANKSADDAPRRLSQDSADKAPSAGVGGASTPTAPAPTMALDEGKAGKPAESRGAPAAPMAGSATGWGAKDAKRDRSAAIETARSAGVLGASDPEPARSGVAAGEWDDNANYRDYTKWLAQSAGGIARLDTRDREFLVVADRDGKPVPNCKITISGQHGSASLVTMASGRALLFPHALGLADETLTATASCLQARTSAQISTKTADNVAKLELPTARALPAKRTIELAFVLDTTGSMSEEIEAVKGTIRTVAAKLSTSQTDVRIGLVEYKDRGDGQVTRTFQFSSDLAQFGKSVDGLYASGGGDMPEDMQAGLSDALDKLAWREDSVARMMVVIADAPPHLDYQDEKDYADAARRAAARGIKLFTVSASGMDSTGQIVMRQMAQFTGASNMFVLRGGAGPQSVGGGDPKSSCGGTHQQYSSGNLDQLIIGKVRQELLSLDADPTRIAGRGQDESAKPCDQRIVLAI
ncbi:MAG: hypothetical protein JWO36_7459 [Myxococcales bacterium]|nr:hypothetical protein [Myxococcales bacterium]